MSTIGPRHIVQLLLPIDLEKVQRLDGDGRPSLVVGHWLGSTVYIVQNGEDGPRVYTFVVGPYSVSIQATKDAAAGPA